MSAITSIETKLKKALEPSHLEVIDESYLHNVEPGRESHVRIVAISNLFEGLNLVKRHQLIYAEIQDENFYLIKLKDLGIFKFSKILIFNFLNGLVKQLKFLFTLFNKS